MELKQSEPVLSCTLEELIAETVRGGGSGVSVSGLTRVPKILASRSHDTRRRKMGNRAADNNRAQIFFDHTELLFRFLLIDHEVQRDLLMAVRALMGKRGAKQMQVTVAWSKEVTRVLQISVSNPDDRFPFDSDLEFSLI